METAVSPYLRLLIVKQAKYHGEGDPNSPIVQLENREMIKDISLTGSDKRWWDYRELWDTRESRYRSLLVVSMAFIGQVSTQRFHLLDKQI